MRFRLYKNEAAERRIENFDVTDEEKFDLCEKYGKYRMLIRSFPTAEIPNLHFVEEKDHVELFEPERAFNRSRNPIIHSLRHPNGLSEMVYALIEYHHLDSGETPDQNRALSRHIRQLGHKVAGQPVDLCGQILSSALGGRMEKQNLFPVSLSTNLDQFVVDERTIYNYVKMNKGYNGRAYFRIRLHYDDEQNSSRPTKFSYSFLLFDDEKDGLQRAPATADEKVNFQIYDKKGKPIMIKDMDVSLAKHKSTVRDERIAKEAREEFEKNSWIPMILDMLTPNYIKMAKQIIENLQNFIGFLSWIGNILRNNGKLTLIALSFVLISYIFRHSTPALHLDNNSKHSETHIHYNYQIVNHKKYVIRLHC